MKCSEGILRQNLRGRRVWRKKAVVADTFPVGCTFDESNVHRKYFKENSDYNNPSFNTKLGVYSEGCGLENVLMSWGLDYMYMVVKENKSTLPPAALFVIRYH